MRQGVRSVPLHSQQEVNSAHATAEVSGLRALGQKHAPRKSRQSHFVDDGAKFVKSEYVCRNLRRMDGCVRESVSYVSQSNYS